MPKLPNPRPLKSIDDLLGSAGIPDNGSTRPTVQPSIRRKVASYKIAETVWQDFAQYVKRLNLDKPAGTETEIGAIAEAALVEYMQRHPVERAGYSNA